MKYVLDNFRSMTSGHFPGLRTDSADYRHRFIQGFVPHYMDLALESADANFKKKVNPAYPLVLAPDRTTVATAASKYPVLMIANEHDTLDKVIWSTDLWQFFSDDSSQTDLGIPSGTPTTNTGIDAIILNGHILTTHPATVTRAYYGEIDSTPSWAATTGSELTAGIRHILKNFEDRALISDSSSGAFTRSDAVKLVLPDFSIIAGITLGDAFDILDFGNFMDRYALIYTRPSVSPRLQRNTIVFVWNAVAGDSYDQKVVLRGVYKCQIEKDGIPHVFTQVGNTVICYAFNGESFREVGSIKNVIISENTLIPKSRIGIEGDFFVLLATSPGNTTNTAPLYWNPATRDSFFLVGALASLPFRCMLIAQVPSNTFAYERYLGYQSAGSVGTIYKLTLENSDRAGISPEYKSNFIPCTPVKGIHEDAGRWQIDRVEIEYSEKPPSSSDIIGFTLTTKDEHESETYTQTTATIKNTTANSTSAKVTDKRAIITVGAKATEFAIDLAITPATASWNLIIRRIVVYYQPIAFN